MMEKGNRNSQAQLFCKKYVQENFLKFLGETSAVNFFAGSNAGHLLRNLQNFSERLSCRTTAICCVWINHFKNIFLKILNVNSYWELQNQKIGKGFKRKKYEQFRFFCPNLLYQSYS